MHVLEFPILPFSLLVIDIKYWIFFFFFEENIIRKEGSKEPIKKSTIRVKISNIQQSQMNNKISKDLRLFKGREVIWLNKNIIIRFTNNVMSNEVARLWANETTPRSRASLLILLITF